MRRVDLTESKDEAVHCSGGSVQGPDVSSAGLLSEAESRFVDHETILSLHKTASGKARQKWEFVWNGFRISGSVLDEDFLRKFEKRVISVEEGDMFKATLRVHKDCDRVSGNWLNKKYEIMEIGKLIYSMNNLTIVDDNEHT